MLGLTPKQTIILKFIRQYVQEHGYSPSYEDIGAGVGLSSLATVYQHIKNLKIRGYIDNQPKSSRSIILK